MTYVYPTADLFCQVVLKTAAACNKLWTESFINFFLYYWYFFFFAHTKLIHTQAKSAYSRFVLCTDFHVFLTQTKFFWSCPYYTNFYMFRRNEISSNVHGSVHRKNILIYIQQDATLHSLFYLETALHVSGSNSTHHQERKQLYLQQLAFVTPLLLPSASGR